MATIDNLLSEVIDATLRDKLIAAVTDLRRNKKFGLVFEEHIPETVLLPAAGVRQGDVVMLRREPQNKTRFIVQELQNKAAEITDGERRQTLPLDGLLVVKPFGEPVYPVLRSTGSVRRGDDKPYHVVVNGENFHALQLLLFGYRGKVDCIYIDPPYNTGARDWKYNNDYVDMKDRWRHSKWLSMMEKRLRLAKELLKPDGVLIVTVDEHEVNNLGVLLREEVFKGYTTYMVNVVHNPKGTYKSNFARVDEYAIFCVPNDLELIQPMGGELFAQAKTPDEMVQIAENDSEIEMLYLRRRGQESGHRRQRPNQFYAILVDEEKREVVGIGQPLGRDEPYEIERHGSIVTVYPLDTRGEERVWRYHPETMSKYIARGEIVVTGYSSRAKQGWVLNHRVVKKETKRLKTVWWEKRHDAGAHGSDILTAYLGDSARFPFPKSVYLVRDCLAAVTLNRPDALIVDFFAGSGTTLHATCLLNADDNGRRRCVMVTNNDVEPQQAGRLNKKNLFVGDPEFEQHGIFHAVTKPRAQAVITGRRSSGEPVPGEHIWAGRRPLAAGFKENIAFFDLAYDDPDAIEVGHRFADIIPALWLAAGAVRDLERIRPDTAWLLTDESHFAVLLDEDKLRPFLSHLKKRSDITHVWLVTDSEAAFARMRDRIPGDRAVSMLYRDYLRNFVVNTEVAR